MAEKLTKKSATIDFMTYFVSLAYFLNYDRYKLTQSISIYTKPFRTSAGICRIKEMAKRKELMKIARRPEWESETDALPRMRYGERSVAVPLKQEVACRMTFTIIPLS